MEYAGGVQIFVAARIAGLAKSCITKNHIKIQQAKLLLARVKMFVT